MKVQLPVNFTTCPSTDGVQPLNFHLPDCPSLVPSFSVVSVKFLSTAAFAASSVSYSVLSTGNTGVGSTPVGAVPQSYSTVNFAVASVKVHFGTRTTSFPGIVKVFVSVPVIVTVPVTFGCHPSKVQVPVLPLYVVSVVVRSGSTVTVVPSAYVFSSGNADELAGFSVPAAKSS